MNEVLHFFGTIGIVPRDVCSWENYFHVCYSIVKRCCEVPAHDPDEWLQSNRPFKFLQMVHWCYVIEPWNFNIM